ncbi:hypothetical protein RvY_05597 [Ramazzottius varieornatus]|uniref:Protein MON2 homolog n=1 Tax=Ramazzottius varieornatus TaxID=947166 RepID=A0A1D1UVL9_RAMVA|nr:hypothetical protein RvY_05597 [Ramazzottius varieornatus]
MASTLSPPDLRFVEGFLGDLRNISNEGRKKHSAVKEASETAIVRLRNLSLNGKDVRQSIVSHCLDLLQPILLAAESGNSKLVVLGLQALQRLFSHETIADTSLPVVMSLMWTLMESHTEELKLIQTITVIITSSNILHGEYLAKSLVICLRMHFNKDPVISNTAGAAIRQIVPLLYEKALEESQLRNGDTRLDSDPNFRLGTAVVPSSLGRCGADAYCLLNDLCMIMNGEQHVWLIGMTEMTRVLALELIESILAGHHALFEAKEFLFLLRERLCPLLIKLISPCIRHSRIASSASSTSPSSLIAEKPSFPVTVHLIRTVFVLLVSYSDLLRNETEIFYSLLMKFVDSDKVQWTKLLALDVLFRLLNDSKMVVLISQTYNTKAASEGVFGDLINTINNYIMAVFVRPNSPSSSASTPTSSTSSNGPPVVSTTFAHKDVNIQLVPLGKAALLESRDSEPPVISDNYGMSVAFACLCFVSRTVLDLLEKNPQFDADRTALQTIVQHSWCGMLSAVSSLLEASCDDSVTDSLLQICKVYVRAAGLCRMDTVREAFITALCKAAFPINYTIGILKSASSRLPSLPNDVTSAPINKTSSDGQTIVDPENRNQIVAVGTPLSSSFQGAVMLTSKNITCLNKLLEMTSTLGDLLDSSWILVLASMQHLAWILGINQFVPGLANGLSKQRQRPSENQQSTILTNVMMSDLPELTKRFDEVFQQTRTLTDASLHHVVSALCKLSADASESAAVTREPSLFPVAKLVDVGMVNLFRIEAWWAPVTQNLAIAAGSSNLVLREWGTDAITILVKESLSFDFQQTLLQSSPALQIKILQPLLGLSQIGWSDVRLKLFISLNHVILSSAEKIGSCWKPIVAVIGAVDGINDENLVRAGFKCIQGVVSDHLQNVSFDCVEQCVDAAAKYGNQPQELNVALTAVGLMWNLADHIYQQRATFGVSQERLQNSMLNLYKQLSQLCLDVRPEVRKSAAQTLFLAIASHGSALDIATWNRLVVDICYILLKCLEKYCTTASEDRISDDDDKVIMHHSRDTAKKQWAETWAIVLPAVTKTITGSFTIVLKFKQSQQVWQGLLYHIQRGGISGLEEVSMSALKCVDDILLLSGPTPSENGRSEAQSPHTKSMLDLSVQMLDDLWKCMHSIGIGLIECMKRKTETDSLPSQKLLTLYSTIFRRLNARMGNNFSSNMLKKLHDVFPAVMLPVLHRNAAKILPCKAEISPLQEAVLMIAESLQTEILKPRSATPHLVTELFGLWLKFARQSTSIPVIGRSLAMDPGYLSTWWAATFSLFSETAMQKVYELYTVTHTWKLVMDSDVLSNIIQALHQPMKLREKDPHQTAWKVAVQTLQKVTSITLPTINAQNAPVFRNIWLHLARTVDDFLYGSEGQNTNWGTEDIDRQVISFFRSEILPQVALVPPDDLKFVILVFNKGSLHAAVMEADHVLPVNSEVFSTICFEALLDFTLRHSEVAEGVGEELDIPSVLLRCEKVFISLSAPSGPPEIMGAMHALRCIKSILSNIKQSHLAKVDRQIWHDVIAMYQKLIQLIPVELNGTLNSDFNRLLSLALLQYSDLIQPPFKR